MGYVLLAVAVVCNAAANVILKLASGRELSFSIAGNGYLIGGLSLFAVNVLLYFAALRALPLSTAYPLMVGGTFLIVSSAAALFLGEPFTLWHWIGYVLILLGIISVTIFGTA